MFLNLTLDVAGSWLLYFLAFTVVGFYALWILYLAVMNLSRVKKLGLLNRTHIILGTPILVVGYLIDFLLNVIVLTPLLFELPRETTVTARLKRLNRAPDTGPWRMKVVKFFEPIVDPFDPSGDHI